MNRQQNANTHARRTIINAYIRHREVKKEEFKALTIFAKNMQKPVEKYDLENIPNYLKDGITNKRRTLFVYQNIRGYDINLKIFNANFLVIGTSTPITIMSKDWLEEIGPDKVFEVRKTLEEIIWLTAKHNGTVIIVRYEAEHPPMDQSLVYKIPGPLMLHTQLVKGLHHTKCPVRIVVETEEGVKLLDKMVIPRGKVVNYEVTKHGISERNLLIHGYDSKRVGEELGHLIKDRILIGHGIRAQLDAFSLDYNPRLHRDLSRSPVALKEGLRKMAGEFTLRDLTIRYLDEEQWKNHKMDPIKLVRSLYEKLKEGWTKPERYQPPAVIPIELPELDEMEFDPRGLDPGLPNEQTEEEELLELIDSNMESFGPENTDTNPPLEESQRPLDEKIERAIRHQSFTKHNLIKDLIKPTNTHHTGQANREQPSTSQTYNNNTHRTINSNRQASNKPHNNLQQSTSNQANPSQNQQRRLQQNQPTNKQATSSMQPNPSNNIQAKSQTKTQGTSKRAHQQPSVGSPSPPKQVKSSTTNNQLPETRLVDQSFFRMGPNVELYPEWGRDLDHTPRITLSDSD